MSGIARFAIFGLVIAGLIWLASFTEWADTEVAVPPKGEAARNRLYATKRLLQQLGVQVESRTSLEALPPPGARLLLTSTHWSLLPGRPARLEAWVRAGGHLVLPASMARHDDFEWLPVQLPERETPPKGDARAAPPRDACRQLTEQGSVPPVLAPGGPLRLCGYSFWNELRPMGGLVPLWGLQGERGFEVLRVPVGVGSVTVIGPPQLLQNRDLFDGDNALVAAAALQARPGVQAWFVAEESREKLVPWVLREGWIAVLLAVLAIAAGLWRGAVRFGPVLGVRPVQRRSMVEQVVGTARFLRHSGAARLHSAQVRALDEAARTRLRGHDIGAPQARATSIAQAVGLPAGELERAMAAGPRDRRSLAIDLDLLETARRRLLHLAPGSTTKDKHANRS